MIHGLMLQSEQMSLESATEALAETGQMDMWLFSVAIWLLLYIHCIHSHRGELD